ncbi:MAG: hypothetical protein LH606_13695, partial [Cytophagaceae bacterium]|nr:hypothetical protein [Cytophagaceae bacterium]
MKKFLLLLIGLSSQYAFAQNLQFFGFFPAYSQTGPISKRLNYNLFLSSTIDALDQTVDGVAYPATTLQW